MVEAVAPASHASRSYRAEARQYAVAVTVSVLALALTMKFRSHLEPSLFLFLYAAVSIAAWYGGLGPGIVASLVTVLGADILLIPPIGSLGFSQPGGVLRLVVMLGVGVLTATLNASLRAARTRADESAAEARKGESTLADLSGDLQSRVDELRASEARYRAVIDAAATVVWRTRADGSAEDMPMWCDITGQSQEQARGSGWLDAIHPADRHRATSVWPEAVASANPMSDEYRIRLADGTYRWFAVRGVPVLDAGGNVREWVGTCTDINARVRRDQHQRFLAEATTALSASLDVDSTLATLARLSIEELADGCLVTLVDEEGRFTHAPVASRDPAKAAIVEDLNRRFPLPTDAPSGYPRVVRTAQPEVVDPRAFDETVLPGIAQTEEHLRLLQALKMYSAMVVPLIARGRTLGAITLVRHGPERRPLFDGADLVLAEDLARRAGLAIDNARLYREAQLAHEESEQARSEAQSANEAKSAFLATMSHELRTPLNAIAGYAQLLELGVRGPVTDEQITDLQRLQRSQRHLLALINELLNFARIEGGHLDLSIEPVPLHETLATIGELITPQVQAKALSYEYLPCDLELVVRADVGKLRQILLNLLSNAVKFTAAGGRIRLRCVEDGSDVTIEVEDTGRGIPEDKLEVVFQPFIQLDAQLTRTHEGIGLGLAISRDLARAMAGDLTARSTIGEGSVFTLRLPRSTDGIGESVAASVQTF